MSTDLNNRELSKDLQLGDHKKLCALANQIHEYMASMLHNDNLENRKNMRCGRVDVEEKASKRRQSGDRSLVVEVSDDDDRDQRELNRGSLKPKEVSIPLISLRKKERGVDKADKEENNNYDKDSNEEMEGEEENDLKLKSQNENAMSQKEGKIKIKEKCKCVRGKNKCSEEGEEESIVKNNEKNDKDKKGQRGMVKRDYLDEDEDNAKSKTEEKESNQKCKCVCAQKKNKSRNEDEEKGKGEKKGTLDKNDKGKKSKRGMVTRDYVNAGKGMKGANKDKKKRKSMKRRIEIVTRDYIDSGVTETGQDYADLLEGLSSKLDKIDSLPNRNENRDVERRKDSNWKPIPDVWGIWQANIVVFHILIIYEPRRF